MNLISALSSVLFSLRGVYRQRKFDTHRETIQVFRTSTFKPPVMNQRRDGFELFYRPRFLRQTMQILVVGAVLAWTFRNYWEIFKNLKS